MSNILDGIVEKAVAQTEEEEFAYHSLKWCRDYNTHFWVNYYTDPTDYLMYGPLFGEGKTKWADRSQVTKQIGFRCKYCQKLKPQPAND